jgi:hypothetical protein
VYDVLLHDCQQGERVLASGLDHDHACAVAKTESQRLGVGRMFLAGSEPGPTRDVVLIVEAPKRAAA